MRCADVVIAIASLAVPCVVVGDYHDYMPELLKSV